MSIDFGTRRVKLALDYAEPNPTFRDRGLRVSFPPTTSPGSPVLAGLSAPGFSSVTFVLFSREALFPPPGQGSRFRTMECFTRCAEEYLGPLPDVQGYLEALPEGFL